MDQIMIRRADAKEIDEVISIAVDTIDESTGWQIKAEQLDKERLNKAFRDIINNKSVVLCAFDDQKLAGFVIFGPSGRNIFTEERTGFIYDLYVMPNYRGRGIAQRLIADCYKLTEEMGFKTIALNVFAKNKPARKLYEKLGFKEYTMVLRKDI